MIKIILVLLALIGAQKQYGYVVEKTLEGGTEYNDYYIVNLDSELHEVEADDLEIEDKVTCYFLGDTIIYTLYEWR